MRLLIALASLGAAQAVAEEMSLEDGWQVCVEADGRRVVERLRDTDAGLLALGALLPGRDGLQLLDDLSRERYLCAPRVLLVAAPELLRAPCPADAVAPLCASPRRLCALLRILAKKPLPRLAAARVEATEAAAAALLNELGLNASLKGRDYAVWLLSRLTLSPMLEAWPVRELYAACARERHTTPAAVERCVRVAVEALFTQGSMRFIERSFGATVDPERGKPTNRAFLLQLAQQLRSGGYSLADTRSENSSEMHHSPAAPTRV